MPLDWPPCAIIVADFASRDSDRRHRIDEKNIVLYPIVTGYLADSSFADT